jgi:RNA recognition motif-containing protein
MISLENTAQSVRLDCKELECHPSPRMLIRDRGDKTDTRGTAFVVYEDIYDAKNAVDHLSGFNVCGRYLIVLYYQASKMQLKADNQKKRRELDELK